MKRKLLMEKYNKDIMAQLKKLKEEGLTEEQKKDIEKKIEEDKAKLN